MSELTKALIGFHKSVDKIEKNARANYGKFADLANVLSTVTPALHANGLVLTQTFEGDSLVTTLHHTSGETLSSNCPLITCEGRNQTQEWGKAVTYQRRFSICSILGVVADMDSDDIPMPSGPASEKVSAALHAAENAIKGAKTQSDCQALSKRLAERKDQAVFTKTEYDKLVQLLSEKQKQVK